MSRLKATEAVYNTLAAGGLKADHASFDDVLFAAVTMAIDPACPTSDLVEWIGSYDDEREEMEIALDLVEYAKCCGLDAGSLDEVFKAAVAAGRQGWQQS